MRVLLSLVLSLLFSLLFSQEQEKVQPIKVELNDGKLKWGAGEELNKNKLKEKISEIKRQDQNAVIKVEIKAGNTEDIHEICAFYFELIALNILHITLNDQKLFVADKKPEKEEDSEEDKHYKYYDIKCELNEGEIIYGYIDLKFDEDEFINSVIEESKKVQVIRLEPNKSLSITNYNKILAFANQNNISVSFQQTNEVKTKQKLILK